MNDWPQLVLARLQQRFVAPSALLLSIVILLSVSWQQWQAQALPQLESQHEAVAAPTLPVTHADLAKIHLFGDAKVVASEAIPTTLSLKLTGIFLANDAKESAAVIVNHDKAKLYHVNDKIEGAELKAINATDVHFLNRGQLEVLALPKLDEK